MVLRNRGRDLRRERARLGGARLRLGLNGSRIGSDLCRKQCARLSLCGNRAFRARYARLVVGELQRMGRHRFAQARVVAHLLPVSRARRRIACRLLQRPVQSALVGHEVARGVGLGRIVGGRLRDGRQFCVDRVDLRLERTLCCGDCLCARQRLGDDGFLRARVDALDGAR